MTAVNAVIVALTAMGAYLSMTMEDPFQQRRFARFRPIIHSARFQLLMGDFAQPIREFLDRFMFVEACIADRAEYKGNIIWNLTVIKPDRYDDLFTIICEIQFSPVGI